MKMRYTIYLVLLLLLFAKGTSAQDGTKPAPKQVRVVDSLTATEKANRDPVLLRSEIDSLIGQYSNSLEPKRDVAPVVASDDSSKLILAGLAAVIALLGFVIYLLYRQRQGKEQVYAGSDDSNKAAGTQPASKEKRSRSSLQSLEAKINELDGELHKLLKENEGLNRVVKEYNGIRHEYDSLKHGMQKAYKVKNYPGYDKNKDENSAMQGVLDTENAVATYAYEKFLKPIIAITDANKNSPAKINQSDQQKLIELLVSLSLLYIEYLYLRVSELSIGGKMVERIKGFGKGNGVDASLLKKLNTEFGSRALVVKMALNKTGVQELSYPVFDETNLNN